MLTHRASTSLARIEDCCSDSDSGSSTEVENVLMMTGSMILINEINDALKIDPFLLVPL